MKVRFFLYVVAIVFSTGLFFSWAVGAGKSGGGSHEPDTVSISGTVSDDPLASATVEILDLASRQLATAKTNNSGYFSIKVPRAGVANGFQLRATGGTTGSVPFRGTLHAIYSAADDKSRANITLLTSLVSRLANSQDGATLIAKRNAQPTSNNRSLHTGRVEICRTRRRQPRRHAFRYPGIKLR